MNFRPSLFGVLLLATAGPALAQPAPEKSMFNFFYPQTERGDVVDVFFGDKIADPYRWLESDARSDAKVQAWIDEQNAVTEKHLNALPGRETFRQRMAALMNHERHSIPLKRGGRYFFARQAGDANQASLYMRDIATGEDRLLIDPNTWSQDNADALGEWGVSDDGRYLAYGVQTGGTDWRAIKVLDVDTGELLGDTLDWARYTRIAWAPDNSGFFYSRLPEPEGGVTSSAGVRDHAVWFHALGTSQEEDRLIFATPDRPGLLNIADRPVNGRFLHISSTPGSSESELTVVDLASDDWTPRTIISGFDTDWSVIANDGAKLIAATTESAERRRIVSLNLDEKRPQLVELLPEAEGSAVLHDAALLGGKLVVAYLVDAQTEIRRFNLDGTPDGTVTLPGIGTAASLTGSVDDNDAFLLFTSYNAPTTIYRYDVKDNVLVAWAEPETPQSLDNITVEQRFYPSKDGTQVPIFIVRRKDVTDAAPTMLYGYGGFGISQLPAYNPLQIAWVEQGGVLAVANIRGGGEYGKAWHQAGQQLKRQNAFDDFIAAGEFLKREGITTPNGLTIQGESGGGLLVGAVTNQRPDLIDVALPGVGVLDMLRYDKFTAGALWTPEFGSPSEEQHYNNLMTYSPYHTVRQSGDYPAILATTADADDRVVPGHTFKYVAALQAVNLGRKPRLVRIETRAGHGAGMPVDKIIAHHADMWAFAAFWTGLHVKP